MNRVKTREIDIDPRGEITWETTDATVDDNGGTLFVAPNSPLEDPLQPLRQFIEGPETYRYINHGLEGTVYATPDEKFAVKNYHLDGDISYLRANVILAEGLKQVRQLTVADFIIRGLEIYAAFIPEEKAREELGAECLWLMELVNEVRYERGDAPSYRYQRKLYRSAVERYKLAEDDICFDCGITNYEMPWHNLMVEQRASEDSPESYVKIDAFPMNNTLSRY